MTKDLDTDIDVSRPSEATQLREIITNHTQGLVISGISGPGGIGKSYLVDHVLSTIDPAKSGWLYLHADAAHPEMRGDFFGIIDGDLARRTLGPPADPRVDYFPQTRRVAAAHRTLITRASKELQRKKAPEEVRRAVVAILTVGHFLNKTIPQTRRGKLDLTQYNLDPDEVGDVIDDAWDAIRMLKTLGDTDWMPEVVRDRLGQSLMSRVKNDLYGATADALVSDLTTSLSGEPANKSSDGAQLRIPGLNRLIIVIDDFEALEATLVDFLISSLIPRLAEAPFATVLIIGGRDELVHSNPGWSHHCKDYLADPIRLRPFDEEMAVQLMEAAGIPLGRRESIFELTQGFPLLLALAIEEAGTDGTSALFLKSFFDRTTRWMSSVEREWFVRTCYLDEVNEDTLRLVFDDEDIGVVQHWFENEASIRDPHARAFTVRPLIREKVISYIEIRSPSRHRELLNRAKPATGAPA